MREERHPPLPTERLVYSVAELQQALSIGRRQAYQLAREIGVRIGERRIVIPRRRVEELLGMESNERGRERGKRLVPVRAQSQVGELAES